MMMKNIKSYSELMTYNSYADRLEYLRLDIPTTIGSSTFGPDRGLNQILYKSPEWTSLRNYIISRDNGCDLGVLGLEIKSHPIVHHINPITKEDILNRSKYVFDPEYLITVSRRTHDLIHYCRKEEEWVERKSDDHIPWR